MNVRSRSQIRNKLYLPPLNEKHRLLVEKLKRSRLREFGDILEALPVEEITRMVKQKKKRMKSEEKSIEFPIVQIFESHSQKKRSHIQHSFSPVAIVNRDKFITQLSLESRNS